MATIIFYLSQNRPEDDVSASGGAVDRKMRWLARADGDSLGGGAGDKLDFVSDNAGDTCNVTVAGYKADGTWVQEVVALNGAAHVQTTNEYLHMRKCEMAADAVGVITVSEYNGGAPAEKFTIPAGERGAAAVFLKAKAEAAGGATKKLYEKVFLVNPDADALTGCKTYMSQDEDAEMKLDLEEDVGGNTVTGGTEQVANRLTEPNVGGGYTWADHATAGTAHVCGDNEDGNMVQDEAQGLWIQLTLAPGRSKELQVLGCQNWVAD